MPDFIPRMPLAHVFCLSVQAVMCPFCTLADKCCQAQPLQPRHPQQARQLQQPPLLLQEVIDFLCNSAPGIELNTVHLVAPFLQLGFWQHLCSTILCHTHILAYTCVVTNRRQHQHLISFCAVQCTVCQLFYSAAVLEDKLAHVCTCQSLRGPTCFEARVKIHDLDCCTNL